MRAVPGGCIGCICTRRRPPNSSLPRLINTGLPPRCAHREQLALQLSEGLPLRVSMLGGGRAGLRHMQGRQGCVYLLSARRLAKLPTGSLTRRLPASYPAHPHITPPSPLPSPAPTHGQVFEHDDALQAGGRRSGAWWSRACLGVLGPVAAYPTPSSRPPIHSSLTATKVVHTIAPI